jgi:transcriptional regulator with XRE-family HTH domain
MDTDFDIEALRSRLRKTLATKGLSKREVSLSAGFGAGYVHSILNEGKEPTVSKLASVCAAANISLGYIIYGVELSPETERLISLIETNPEKRDMILALLRP